MNGPKNALEKVQTHNPLVTKVEDGTKPLIVSIRKSDQRDANRKDPDSCPIALACGRKGWCAMVYLSKVYLVFGTTARRYATSTAMRKQIVRFDRTGRFAPGSYALIPPPPSHRLIGKRRHQPKGIKTLRRHRRPTRGVRVYAA